MSAISRRTFGALGLAAAGSAATPAWAQAAGPSFMSFTFAEDPNKPFVEKLLADFRAASGLAVEPIGSAWGDMQRNLLLRRRSNTLPVTAQVSERWVPALAQMPEVVDLDQLLGRATLEAAMAPEVLAMGQIKGKTVALPLITGSVGMVANKEVMEKAGIAQVPTTLAEFRAACIQVRDRVPNVVPFAMATKNVNSIPLDVTLMVWAHGGRLIDEEGVVKVDSPEARAALAYLVDMMRNRLIAPELDRPDSRRLFGQGAAAFYIDPPQARGFARSFSGRGPAADAFVLPMKMPVLKAGDTSHSIMWGHAVMAFRGPMTASADAPGAQWLRFLLSDAAQTTFPPALSALPATKTGQASPVVQGDAFYRDWATAAAVPRMHEIGVWSNAPELSTILSEETQAALLGQKTSDAAITAMAQRMTVSMARRGG